MKKRTFLLSWLVAMLPRPVIAIPAAFVEYRFKKGDPILPWIERVEGGPQCGVWGADVLVERHPDFVAVYPLVKTAGLFAFMTEQSEARELFLMDFSALKGKATIHGAPTVINCDPRR